MAVTATMQDNSVHLDIVKLHPLFLEIRHIKLLYNATAYVSAWPASIPTSPGWVY